LASPPPPDASSAVAQVVVMSSSVMPLLQEDRHTLVALRDRLTAERLSLGLTHAQACQRVGKTANFLYEMENLKSQLKMDNLQLWASMYGFRLECQVRDFWQFIWPNDELMMMYRMSRPFAEKPMARLWLVAALAAYRERVGLSCMDVGNWLGLTRGAISAWECTTTNPLMVRAMAHARACHTAIDLKLYTREEWKFG